MQSRDLYRALLRAFRSLRNTNVDSGTSTFGDNKGEIFIACGRPRPPLKPGHLSVVTHGPAPMLAIGIIAIFLVVILGLNKFEFGRFD